MLISPLLRQNRAYCRHGHTHTCSIKGSQTISFIQSLAFPQSLSLISMEEEKKNNYRTST